MLFIQKFKSFLEGFLDYITLLIFIAMIFSIVTQVFARFVLQNPTVWSEELARFLMVALTMFGSAAVISREGHISVTVLTDRLTDKQKHIVFFVRDVLIIGMASCLSYFGTALAYIARNQISTGMEIPMYLPYLAIPIGSAFLAIMLVLTRITPVESEESEK